MKFLLIIEHRMQVGDVIGGKGRLLLFLFSEELFGSAGAEAMWLQ